MDRGSRPRDRGGRRQYLERLVGICLYLTIKNIDVVVLHHAYMTLEIQYARTSTEGC